jgi:hypothetical protein
VFCLPYRERLNHIRTHDVENGQEKAGDVCVSRQKRKPDLAQLRVAGLGIMELNRVSFCKSVVRDVLLTMGYRVGNTQSL